MNKLDGKVIVDRDLFRALYLLARNSYTSKLREADAATCRELWNQDLTGWAAVPVEHTPDMASAAVKALEDSICADIDFHLSWVNTADQEVQLVSCLGRTHRAMLNASPALFETKEKQNEQA